MPVSGGGLSAAVVGPRPAPAACLPMPLVDPVTITRLPRMSHSARGPSGRAWAMSPTGEGSPGAVCGAQKAAVWAQNAAMGARDTSEQCMDPHFPADVPGWCASARRVG